MNKLKKNCHIVYRSLLELSSSHEIYLECTMCRKKYKNQVYWIQHLKKIHYILHVNVYFTRVSRQRVLYRVIVLLAGALQIGDQLPCRLLAGGQLSHNMSRYIVLCVVHLHLGVPLIDQATARLKSVKCLIDQAAAWSKSGGCLIN